MNFDEALSYLLSLGHETLAMKLGLTNTELLLQALGNPQKNYPAVQIAGTNGKGSTAVMLDSICRAAGLRTALFTSPHLIQITERVRIDGREITEGEFARLATTVRKAVSRLLADGTIATPPTFFEQLTAIALLAFAEAQVNLAILETGLGGRLDSTTVARAETIAITPIALDHQQYLGNSLTEIAGEKAAIIRPGVAAIIAPQSEEALAVIIARCKESGVHPVIIGSQPGSLDANYAQAHFRFRNASEDGRCSADFNTGATEYLDVQLSLRGRHQIGNATTAIALAEALRARGMAISHEAIVAGVQRARHRGRLELCESRPRILLDGAHNPAAAGALRDYLDEFVKSPITMVFGAMKDKDLKSLTDILFPAAAHLVLTQPDNARAASVTLLKTMTAGGDSSRISVARNTEEALRRAVSLTQPDSVICVTGSLYLVGEAFRFLEDHKYRLQKDSSV